MDAATLYATEVLCYANIQPIERAWQRTGHGWAIQQGPSGNQNYMQLVLRFFKLLAGSWHCCFQAETWLLDRAGVINSSACGRAKKTAKRSEEAWIGNWWARGTCLHWRRPSHSASGLYQDCGPWIAGAFDVLRNTDNLNFYMSSLDIKCWINSNGFQIQPWLN